MGLIGLIKSLFGASSNVREIAEVFRPNAEASAQREAEYSSAALDQLAREFDRPQRGRFDAIVDGLNRLPRPIMALGVIGLFIAAMTDPIWFGERMAGLALVPEPLWWLLGIIVTFYFGARYQAKVQDFQRSIAAGLARVPTVTKAIAEIRGWDELTPGVADAGTDADAALTAHQDGFNPALAELPGYGR